MRQPIQRIGFCALMIAGFALPARADPLPAGFVRLADVAPSIRQDIRYAATDNFLHRKVNGYDAPVCILTRESAEALSRVQRAIATRGLTLVVFDCYRPARAVADMGHWTAAGGPPDPQWYPTVKRGDLIAKGYVGERSSHSRGSTVDVAIGPVDSTPVPKPACGAINADTVDFGTGFDCFDPKSETAHRPLGAEAAANRKLLVDAMRAGGFKNHTREWWHFALARGPFQKQRFDFPVTAE
ncbi:MULTISPECIES: M15 family metallopeptidase [unclassified Mesorhizobium]|uniref:M15 family metallopeptidase n=1 Tax=Mesorhizobium TaxID=68287 RepID=UPI0003CE8B9C|nr:MULTISPECIES: M15 family metallopeptidase [unclassified Mesorhizobium]ESY97079.1 D-alanyl-D-alanine dipeptidase [Mesorhizobium sp. LNHC229A00]ESZ01760.1 D-alanyl-D-alanine dipeptidase [Mesorhizobium sp. LNHC209A00]